MTFGSDGVMQTARRATASIADPGDDRVPASDLGDNMRIGRRAEIRLDARDDIGHRKLVAQDAFEMNATVFPASVSRRGAGSPSGGAVSFVGSSTRKVIPVSPVSLLSKKSIDPGGVGRPSYSNRPPLFSTLPIADGPEPRPSPGWFEKAAKGLIPSLFISYEAACPAGATWILLQRHDWGRWQNDQ